jgi:tRNA (Thr-GGU) A37 N-methylase
LAAGRSERAIQTPPRWPRSGVLVRSLEAVDGTPILDIKGVLNPDIQQR